MPLLVVLLNINARSLHNLLCLVTVVHNEIVKCSNKVLGCFIFDQ